MRARSRWPRSEGCAGRPLGGAGRAFPVLMRCPGAWLLGFQAGDGPASAGMRPRRRCEPTGPSPTGSCPGPRPFLPTPPQRPVPTSLLPCPQDLQASPTHRPIPVPPPGQCPPPGLSPLPGPSPLPGLSSLPVPTAPRPAQHSATEPHPLKGGPHHVAATAEVPLRACCWFLISAPKQNAGPPGGGCVHRPPWGLPAPGSEPGTQQGPGVLGPGPRL